METTPVATMGKGGGEIKNLESKEQEIKNSGRKLIRTGGRWSLGEVTFDDL